MKYLHENQLCGMNIHYGNYTLEYFLDAQARLGITHVELLAGHQGLWIDSRSYADTKPIRKMLLDRGISCSVITPENIDCPYQYSAQGKELFQRSVEYFKNGIRMGAELGCKIMAANSGWGYLNESYEDGFNRCVDMFGILSEVCQEHNMNLAVESLRPEETNLALNLPHTKELLDAVAHPCCKAMIDLTAMGVAGETIDDWFDTFGVERIIHTHFIDGNPYGHLVWGHGTRGLEKSLRALHRHGYTGLLSQELTDGSYYQNPVATDEENIQMLRQFVHQ